LERGLTGRSLNLTLTELGLLSAGGEDTAGVLPALSETDAVLMNRRAGEPILRLSRTTRLEDGTVLEHMESILDSTHFGLWLSF
jgi:GntR family transcriptional regulator